MLTPSLEWEGVEADVLIACVAEDRKGGTEDTIKKFQKLGKTQLILV